MFCLNFDIFRAREKSQFKLRNSTKVRRYQHVTHIRNCAKLFSLLAQSLFIVQVWRHWEPIQSDQQPSSAAGWPLWSRRWHLYTWTFCDEVVWWQGRYVTETICDRNIRKPFKLVMFSKNFEFWIHHEIFELFTDSYLLKYDFSSLVFTVICR